MHAEWTIAAARAGKHVLCEKPIALTSAEAESMVDACDEAGVIMREAFMYRFHPTWLAAQRLVAEGGIGEVIARCVVLGRPAVGDRDDGQFQGNEAGWR